MKRTKLNSILAKVVTTSFIFTTLPTAAFAEVVNDNKELVKLQVNIPTVSPTPHNIEGSGEGFILTEKVNIVGQEQADQDAIRELVEALKGLGIEVNNDFDENATTIIIGEDDDNIEEMNTFFEGISKSGAESIEVKEGYVLASNQNEDGKMTIAIEGTDEVGTYYGVKTLKQLLIKESDRNVVPEVYVNDYPTQHVRAVVEGFYGTPWTHQDRLDQFKFYGENKLNMYIYAPKDDPYHRDQWRDPYPQEEMARMQELINTANENKVDFVFAISPGKDIDINSEADYQALVDKCESLYDMGVRSFAILWDDIFTDDGAGQAAIMNRFNAEFVKTKEGVKPLITVPTQYWGTSMFNGSEVKPYTEGFSKNLDKEIIVKVTSNYQDTLFYKRNNYLNNLINSESSFQNNFKLVVNLVSIILLTNYLIIYLFTKNIYVLPLYFILLINLFSKVINILVKNLFIKSFKDNIYFKNKDIFFELRKVKNIFFDKSGVITTGEYRITKVKASNEDEFYKYLLIGENKVNNKISEVIKEHKCIDINGYLDKVKNYKYINGRGISYKYEKNNILIGNEYFLKEHNIEVERIDEVGTTIYVVKDKELVGYLVISDTIKKSVKKNLLKLEEFGLIRKFLFSGDNTRIVSVIAKEVGILDYYSNANIYEKGFWYLYNSKKYKGKNVYVRNSEFDSEYLNVDINIDFNNKDILFNNSDILVDNDIYSLVKLFKYIKDFMGDFIKNILLLIIFTIIDILLICFGINYLSIIFSVNILIFIIIYYNNYIK